MLSDEDVIDSKTEELRKKLQDRNKKRIAEKIASANLLNVRKIGIFHTSYSVV